MPLITETYYLSLTQDNRGILRLRCSQDDTLRTVNLKLYNNGSIFVIPSGISASISGVKQNGAVFSKPCTISQNRESVVLQLSSDITNVDGIIVAEIVLNDGEGGRLGTSNFIIQVEKNPIRAGVVQDTETPIEYINDFIEKIQTLTARLNNLITPSGDPSLAEVVDARIGILDSTTYQTLGARLNAEFQRLSNALSGAAILESTGDTTDRTSEILSKLNAYGTCKLGKGDFYVNSLVMPEGSHLVGSGKSTRIILPSSVTNRYVVKPRSNCIIENVSFYGGFTGTYSELIASSASATRHCIILDRFDSVNSENVILSNISINNFVGSAIIQRYTTGCHCKDVVINMCYAGIDISNASYDGQCINISMTNTRYGIVQNGSNFVFTNCISKDSEYHIMSDRQNTECTFLSCTFFDSSLETTSILAYLSNARNGFVFDNCIFDSSLKMGLNACDGIVIKGTNFVGSDTFRIIVSNGRNTLLLITDCIADVEPVVTNAGTAARITSCYLKDGTAWSISEVDITVDDELSDESENPIQNKVVASAISEINGSLGDLSNLETTDKSSIVAAINEAAQSGGTEIIVDDTLTQSGQAADAKKTGDEISAIKANLDNRTSFDLLRNISWIDNQYVNYNTGVVDDNNSLSYCVIDISELDIYTLTITSYFSSVAGVVFKSELSVTNAGYISGYRHSSGEYTDTVEIPEGAKYLYISCVKSKKSVVGVESLTNYEVDGCKSRIEDLSNNKMPATNYCENVDLTIESGIIKKDLSVSTLSSANKHAEKIVTRGTYYVTCYSISASYPGAFYVKDGTTVTLLGGASVIYDNVEINIPEGVNTLYLNGDTNVVLPELRKVTGIVNVESFVNLYCIISNDEAKIKSKYNDKDLIVKFGKGGGNNLPDFRGFSVVNNTSMGVNNKMNGTPVLTVSSDWFAPFVVQAINNIDGDLPTGYESHFTGGNHEYTNTGAGGMATARCTSLKYFVDGVETDSFVGFAKNILIKWTNNVQGNNTKKADGTGREILQENHELYFDGKEWKAFVELIPLEEINMLRWYGLQCPHKGTNTSTVNYVGGVNRGAYAGNSNSNSGNNTCPEIRIKTDSFSVILGVDSGYDCGSRLFYDGTSGAFNVGSSKKSYFWIISNTQMALGDRYYLKGYYRFPSI